MEVGKYTLTKEIGSGGYGTTYLAQTTTYNQNTGQSETSTYVVKLINTETVDANLLNNYVRFLKSLANISSMLESELYINRYHEILRTNVNNESVIAIVTDHVKGKTLDEYMNEGNDLGFNDALQICTQISESLDFLHTYKIAHRNIKPTNIMYDEDLDRWKLVDYSISCSKFFLNLCPNPNPQDIYYTAPESLIASETSHSFKDYLAQDIWVLGVVFYGLLNNGNSIIAMDDSNSSLKQQLQLVAAGSKQVQKSQYVYSPLNSIVDAMLQVDWTSRPTSGQVLFLLYLARPGCSIDGTTFSHDEVQSLLYSFGIDPKNYNDYELCRDLTNQIEICNVRQNDYRRVQLLELSDLIGLENAESMNIAELCKAVKDKLDQDQNEIKRTITSQIIQAIGYLAYTKARDVNTKFESGTVQRLEDHLQKILNYGLENDLIDPDLLDRYRVEIYRRYKHLASTASISFGYVYALQNNYIVKLISKVAPDFDSNNLPILQYLIK